MSHQTKPLYFDDVFSELDNDRTERLLHLLVADQTFITTAIQPKIIQQNMYHEVKEGKVMFHDLGSFRKRTEPTQKA